MFLFTPNISVYQGQVGEKFNSNSCSLPGANSFPGLCGTSWKRARAKGSRQKYLLLWQQSGSAAVLLSSPCCQNIQTLLSATPPPSTILPSPSKEAGRQHREEAGQVWRRTGEGHSRRGGRPHLLLLLHILAQIPCPEQWAPKRNASEVQTQNLLFCARLKKGRCVVVWLVLIHIFKLYVKLFCDGGKAEIVPR